MRSVAPALRLPYLKLAEQNLRGIRDRVHGLLERLGVMPGRGPGYLNDPDGVDLMPPDSLLITHAGTMGQP